MRPPFAGARSGDFLAEQKIRGFGFCKGLDWLDCLGSVMRPPFAGVRSGDFLAEQKIRGIGSCKRLGFRIARGFKSRVGFCRWLGRSLVWDNRA